LNNTWQLSDKKLTSSYKSKKSKTNSIWLIIWIQLSKIKVLSQLHTATLILVSAVMGKSMAEDIRMGTLVSRMGEVIQLIKRKGLMATRIMKDLVRIMVLLIDLRRNDTHINIIILFYLII